MMSEYGGQETWQEDLYSLLRSNDVELFCYVPDGGHKTLINRSIEDPEVISVPLTTEEEGVAMCAGAHLGGTKSVLLMQSSGVGNCVNMFALIKNGQFPFVTVVTMRGEFGEMNPWQVPMGARCSACCRSHGDALPASRDTGRGFSDSPSSFGYGL